MIDRGAIKFSTLKYEHNELILFNCRRTYWVQEYPTFLYSYYVSLYNDRKITRFTHVIHCLTISSLYFFAAAKDILMICFSSLKLLSLLLTNLLLLYAYLLNLSIG